MDKIERLLDAVEHTDRYTPAEIEAMLQDPEVREVFDLLDITKSSLQTVTTPDIDAEWKKFEERHRDFGTPRRNWLVSLFSRNAAASIAIAVASFTAVAALVGVGIYHLNDRHETTAKEMEVVTESKTIPTQPDTIKSVEVAKASEIVVFDNEPLELILNNIADYYDCKVAFNNEASKSLRLYFRWNQALTVEETVERLNNFEQIQLTVKDNTIKVD